MYIAGKSCIAVFSHCIMVEKFLAGLGKSVYLVLYNCIKFFSANQDITVILSYIAM